MNTVIKRAWNKNRLVKVEDLTGMTFQAESGGHTFEISGVDDTGASVSLSGTVEARFLRADNAEIIISGTVSSGKASVTLSAACYAIPGRFLLTVYVTSGGQKVAVYAATGSVVATSGTAGGSIPPLVTDSIIAGDATVNGVLDVTPRRCYANLSSAGWYRVFNVTAGLGRAGSAFSIVLHIGRSFDQDNNELHTVTLLANYNNQEFSSEVSNSNSLGITKVRYTADGSNNGHIDIYYDLTAENLVYVDFDVHCRPEKAYLIRYNSVTPTAVADSPSGETVLTEYTFAANTMQQSVTIPSSQFSSGNGTIWGSESNVKLVWDNKKVVMTGFIFIQNPAVGVLQVDFPTPTGFPYDKFNGNWLIVGQTYRRAGSYMQTGDLAYGVVNSSVIRIAERNVFTSHQATDYAMITIPTATYYF